MTLRGAVEGCEPATAEPKGRARWRKSLVPGMMVDLRMEDALWDVNIYKVSISQN